MSTSDHGIHENERANEGTISNQSGDTFLLTDDEAEVVQSYAESLRRETSTPNEITPGSQTEESYLGRGRRVTDFERAHFTEENITPGRPCTAYFSAEYFVDSQAVFDKLAELDIPRESVVCLARRPSRDMIITFKDQATKNHFVSYVAIRFHDSTSVINDEDMPLTFLNVYDAPHELSDEALTLRLEKYCEVVSSRRGKLSRSHVYNGIRHYRVRIKEPLPSYLRFGKFLVRLSHDGQQHTCRRCNRAGHFANECQNIVCFNCDELGHQSRDCGEAVRCCICKSTEHLARRCPYSWYNRPILSAPVSNRRSSGPASGGNVAASASDQPSSSPSTVRDPGPGGDVAAPASDPSFPSTRDDSLRDVFQPDVSDSDLLAAAGQSSSSSSVQPPGEVSDPPVVNSQGFLWEQIAFRLRQQGAVPNPPGPKSSSDVDSMSYPENNDQSVSLPVDLSADLFDDSPIVPSADMPAATSADPPVDSPVDAPVDPPADQPVPPCDVPPGDQSSSSPTTPSNQSKVLSSRRKPAPMPPALEALSRRPTRPTLAVSGKSSSADSSPGPPGGGGESDVVEMDSQSSLKRKQDVSRKKGDPKKGKHK